MSNHHFDEGLKKLKANEFRTYIGLIYLIKLSGPNSRICTSTKKGLFSQISKIFSISKKTFLNHLRVFEKKELITVKGRVFDIGFDIEYAKKKGFTPLNVDALKYMMENLDHNELKLYLTFLRLLKGFNRVSATITYAQLKSWSAIKNKAIFISTRNSLMKKGFYFCYAVCRTKNL